MKNLTRECKNYQGKSFKDQKLRNRNFTGADIRSADFTGANLEGANFSGAIAGLEPRVAIGLLIIAALLSAFSGVTTGIVAYIPVNLFLSQPIEQTRIVSGTLIVLVNLVFLLITIFKGLQKALGFFAVFVALIVSLVAILALLGSENFKPLSGLKVFRISFFIDALSGKIDSAPPLIVLALAIALAATISIVVTLSLAISIAWFILESKEKYLIIAEASVIAVSVSGIITKNFARTLNTEVLKPVSVITAVIMALALVFVGIYVASQIFAEKERYALLRQIALDLASWRGTSFRNAILTDANFTEAILKSTDFREARLTRTCWRDAKKLNYVRPGTTYLSNPSIRELVKTGLGKKLELNRLNLRDVNLQKADLENASFIDADLSQANLNGANLMNASFIGANLNQANLQEANLSGACIEDWNINSGTNLDNVICDYVYLKEGQQERRPHTGNFQPGEFSKVFQEFLETVDLIFREGVDWKAFTYSFTNTQIVNEDITLDIQSIENKGDGTVVIKVCVPSDADKEKIYDDFWKGYEFVHKTLEMQYQARLEDKDKHINQLFYLLNQSNKIQSEVQKIMAETPKYHVQGSQVYGFAPDF